MSFLLAYCWAKNQLLSEFSTTSDAGCPTGAGPVDDGCPSDLDASQSLLTSCPPRVLARAYMITIEHYDTATYARCTTLCAVHIREALLCLTPIKAACAAASRVAKGRAPMLNLPSP